MQKLVSVSLIMMVCTEVFSLNAELEITVGHWTFSMHIAQMSEHSSLCADIMSRHSLEQKLSTVVAYMQPQLTVHSAYGE